MAVRQKRVRERSRRTRTLMRVVLCFDAILWELEG